MFGSLGTPEIVIIGIVIILIFGVGKLSGLGRDLGSSIKEFRRAVRDEDADKEQQRQQLASSQEPPQQPPPAQPQQQAPAPPPQQPQYTAPPQTPPPSGRDQSNPNIF